jgi:nucleoside-diphosphate-sugar epimerase
MKILVTGVAGAIGSHLAERLLTLGHEVVGVDALTDYYSLAIKKINAQDVENLGAEVLFKNLTSDDLTGVVNSVDVIFHLAAQPGISVTTPFDHYLNNNLIATYRLLELAKKAPKLKMFFHASTSSVYGALANGNEKVEPRPTSYYGVTKLAAEQLALSYYREGGLPVSVLRFFSVYGERERPEKFYHRLIRSILEKKAVPFYEGSEKHIRSYSYISDIIDGCILALNHPNKVIGEIFNLGTDQTMTTGQGLDLVEKIMGRKAKLKILPRRVGDQIETAADITKARMILGYNPEVPLAQGLEAQVKWYRDKIHGKIK